jgi:hypothetical protein
MASRCGPGAPKLPSDAHVLLHSHRPRSSHHHVIPECLSTTSGNCLGPPSPGLLRAMAARRGPRRPGRARRRAPRGPGPISAGGRRQTRPPETARGRQPAAQAEVGTTTGAQAEIGTTTGGASRRRHDHRGTGGARSPAAAFRALVPARGTPADAEPGVANANAHHWCARTVTGGRVAFVESLAQNLAVVAVDAVPRQRLRRERPTPDTGRPRGSNRRTPAAQTDGWRF